MITGIEYLNGLEGVRNALTADKNVVTRNAWHLASVAGNGLPPITMNGSSSYGVAGRSFGGVSVGGREIEVGLYADGYCPKGCQALLSDASRVFSADHELLGVLRLRNEAGDWFRIPARAILFDVEKQHRRSALCNAVFDCPYPYFESDVLHRAPLFAVNGGKEYPLERPYTFGEIDESAGDQTVVVRNEGDVAAPCVFSLYGSGLTRVEITNQTTGASVIVSGFFVDDILGVDGGDGIRGGIEISTDDNDVYARFTDGTDASAYVSLFSDLSAFKLASGDNVINVKMTATSVTVAGTEIMWRGRFSTCL